MKPEIVIYTLLSAASGVTALAGSRIYEDVAPQGVTKPYIVLGLITDTPQLPIDATPGADLWIGRMQVTCMGATSESGKMLCEAVMAACYKKNGTIAGVPVVAVLVGARGASLYGMDVDTYQQSVDFMITYYR